VSDALPLRTRLIVMAVSCTLTFGVAEGLVRVVDGNALPMIHLFEQTEAGTIQLVPGSTMNVSRAGGPPWRLSISAEGFRGAAPDSRWLAVGDSQVMGNGVEAEETFSAVARIDGQPLLNAGVPGYGVQDALERAERELRHRALDGVVVFVNQMNDWEEVRASVDTRYVVRGGWLLKPVDADSARGKFLASPLAHSHLCFLLGQLVLRDWSAPPPDPPDWMVNPTGQRESTITIARQLHSFSARHPGIRVVPVYLPADLYAAEGRLGESPLTPHVDAVDVPPWTDTRLRDATLQTLVGLSPLDLSPVLSGRTDAFLNADYHLSASGHALVAQAIEAHVHTQ
jgi:hypothetical protein